MKRLLTEEEIATHFGSDYRPVVGIEVKFLRRAKCTTCGKKVTVCFVPKPGVPVFCDRCLRLRKQSRKQSFAAAFGAR